MLNLHRLFHSFRNEPNFLSNLTLDEDILLTLADAKKRVRHRLRTAIARETAAATRLLGIAEGVQPKFFTQGSQAYKTLNYPTHLPPQQADADDGCYLPLSFLKGAKPKQSAEWFFTVADKALAQLVAEQGWRSYSIEKDTCCRVVINDVIHIDVPLYAIQDAAYERLRTEALSRNFTLDEAMSSGDPLVKSWAKLERDEVLMAKRDGTWQASDPREVKDWADKIFAGPGGDQLRRQCRYSKGWRDQVWKSRGPSSITLMVIAAESFQPVHGRDDRAFLEIMRSTAEKLGGDIYAPWGDRKEQINRLDENERMIARMQAAAMRDQLSAAVNARWEDRHAAVSRLATAMGCHFPNAPDWILADNVPDVVKASPAIITPNASPPKSTRAG